MGLLYSMQLFFLPTRAFLILNHISTSQEKARNIRQKLFVQKSKCIILITKILKQYETITNLNGAIIIKLLNLAKAKLSMSISELYQISQNKVHLHLQYIVVVE